MHLRRRGEDRFGEEDFWTEDGYRDSDGDGLLWSSDLFDDADREVVEGAALARAAACRAGPSFLRRGDWVLASSTCRHTYLYSVAAANAAPAHTDLLCA